MLNGVGSAVGAVARGVSRSARTVINSDPVRTWRFNREVKPFLNTPDIQQ
jgi:hypothetical protein